MTTRPMTPLERSRAIAYVARQQALVAAVPKAVRYQDYRKMLEQQKDIDAVVVATPDHMHASIALAAMDLGKHVYVEKPLTWSVAEARQLSKRATETRVATQMGNQGHSLDDGRKAVEYPAGGRHRRGQGDPNLDQPSARVSATASRARRQSRGRPRTCAGTPRASMRVSARRCWATTRCRRAWRGTCSSASRHRSSTPGLPPFNWRGWVDWGAGPLGDMGAHLINHASWALDLGFPRRSRRCRRR